METQVCPAPLTLASAPTAVEPGQRWLASPVFDALFLANIGWLAVLLPGFAADDGSTPISFWQVYFLTVPHRWLTLALVAIDPDRRERRGRRFLLLALAAFLLVLGIRLVTGGFICLLLLDYIWNGWHFASQHAGVLRMYSAKTGGGAWPALERYGPRLFIFYVIARTAGWSTGWLEEIPDGLAWAKRLDVLMLLIPALLLLFEFAAGWGRRPGKRLYLLSVCGLYAGLLLALNGSHTPLVFALTVAAAWFHASEYLAVVTLYAWQRRTVGTDGLMRRLAVPWLQMLAGFLLLLGIAALVGERLGGDFWLGLNLWAALLHYAYDGMIWKLRRPATAQALGVSSAVSRENGT